MKLNWTDLSPHIGSQVEVSKEILLEGSYSREIRQLLEQRGVLVFRRLCLTGPEQLAFSKTLGRISGKDDDDGILKITLDKSENARADYLRGSFFWHIDNTTDDVPSRASLLTAVRLSSVGGQTEFANTYAAYDSLPEEEKRAIDHVRVVHSFEISQRYVNPTPSYAELTAWQQFKPKTHPLVWHHQSGRKSLVLGSTASHVEGMSLEEGRLLLCKLQEWATQPQFVYRHEWTVGDLLIWDNTGTMHRVQPYPLDSGRMMHRTTLVGEEALS